MQSIQELSPESARQHGLALRHWPAPGPAPVACPAQQVSHLSLQESPASCSGLPPAGLSQASQRPPEAHSATGRRDIQEDSHSHSHAGQEQGQGQSGSGGPHSALSAPRRPRSMAASLVESACNGASTAGQKNESRVAQQSSLAEAQVLTCEASVPGHRWLPCPTLRTPDAAESDYITVCHRPCEKVLKPSFVSPPYGAGLTRRARALQI